MEVLNGVLISVTNSDLNVLKFNEKRFWKDINCIFADSFYDVQDKLSSLKIPDGIDMFADGVFEDYVNLRKIELPNTLKKLEDKMFLNCENLRVVMLPEKVEEIGASVFENCKSLKTVKLPQTLQIIGKNAFGCSGLKYIKIPSSVKVIKSGAFDNCLSLTDVKMSDGLKEIGDSAFHFCGKLEKVKIPKTVEKIGKGAFSNCLNLYVAEIPDGVREIESGAFENCKKLLTIHIPNGITKIADNTFSNCEWIADITIPNSVTEIGARAFRNCYCMTELNIPNSVKQISESSFDGCNFEYATKTKDGWYLSVDKPDGEKTVVPFEFFRELCKNNAIDEIDTYDFRFFNNELKPFLKDIENNPDFGNLFKFAKVIGCFSREKIRDKNKRETEAYLGQKASSFLASILNRKVMNITDFSVFDYLDAGIVPSQELFEFLSYGENSKFKNLEMLLQLEKQQEETFSTVLKNFKDLQMCRLDVKPDGSSINCSWDKAIRRLLQLKSTGRDISDTIIFNKLSADENEELLELTNFAKENDVPHHILGKELKEITILEQIETIKNNTKELLAGDLELISDLYEKQFTYEFLDKHNPKNAIIGLYTSCCASITRSEYGREIAISTMTAKDVQNLIIRDSKGQIIAKGTLFINKEKGFGVFNDFELNYKYRKNETTPGKYKDDEFSENEMVREKIFAALMRGIQDFINEYDKQNPNNPIQKINVGMEFNRLKRQCERLEKETNNLTVPLQYSFEDAEGEQRVLYDRSGVTKLKPSSNVREISEIKENKEKQKVKDVKGEQTK